MKRFFQNPFVIILILVMVYNAVVGGRFESPVDWLMSVLLTLPGIIIGLSFHEFAHAVVAWKCGDDTPLMQGRVTTNPIAHVDPVGFIALLFIGFGWGKPVMINPMNFKHARRDDFLVSIAGVTMNLILAVAFTGIWRLVDVLAPDFMNGSMGEILTQILVYIIYINLVLMLFNLLPVPPLDGFNIVSALFDLEGKPIHDLLYRNGFVILMLLILFNITDKVLSPAVLWCFYFLTELFF